MIFIYDNPDEEVGIFFDFGGLCVPNGQPFEVSKEEVDAFRRRNGVSLSEAIRRTPVTYIPKTKSGVNS